MQVSQTIQVMIVDDMEESRASVKLMLDLVDGVEVIAEAKDGVDALARLAVVAPDVILMDINMPVMDGVEATEKITLQYPNIAVVVLSVQNDVEYIKRCMRAGAKDYLFKPVTIDVLAETIENVAESERNRHSRNTVAVLADHFTQRAKVMSFVSAKGGVGKTTMATSIAAAYASLGKRVVYVDCDLQFGDGSLFFNLSAPRTMLDLVRESNEIDPDVLERYLTTHPSGVRVLPAPPRPEESEYITAAQVRVILQALRKRFDFVIVDTSPVANDVFFAVLETSDDVYMVSTLNLAVLKNNRLLLDLLVAIGYEVGGIRHVLNRANARNGLKIRDAQRVLQADVYWELDNDYQFVETAINEGMPFVLREGKHRLAKQVYALVARIAQEDGGRASRRHPLRRLFAVKPS